MPCCLVEDHFEYKHLKKGKCKVDWTLSVKHGKKAIFLKKGKTIISVEILYISDDKKDFTVEFVSRNLVTPSNFETIEISCFSRHQVLGDTWHDPIDVIWHLRGGTHGMKCGALV